MAERRMTKKLRQEILDLNKSGVPSWKIAEMLNISHCRVVNVLPEYTPRG